MKTETGIYTGNIVPLKPNTCHENSLWTTCTWSKQTAQLWLKLLQFNGSHLTAKIANKSSNPLKSGRQKILCRDNDCVQNLANAAEETKKIASKGLKNIHQINMLCQLHPTNPNNQETRTTLILSGSHQNNKDTKLQTNYICIFVISLWKGLGQWLRQVTKKNQKDIKLLNSANEAAACLVELVNKERDDTNTWKKKQSIKKRNMKMTVVKRNMSKKKNRCQKKLGQKKMRVWRLLCVRNSTFLN